MKYTKILLLSILFSSCTKEQITLYTSTIENTTSHNVVIKPYFSGIAPQEKMILIMPNQNFQIANGTERGITENSGFYSNYLSGSDSIIIIFDNEYQITHYFQQPIELAQNYYFLSSPRNLYNKDNYTYTYNDISKNRRESFYLYQIKEQDYLDAR